jgi:hypothetical protein
MAETFKCPKHSHSSHRRQDNLNGSEGSGSANRIAQQSAKSGPSEMPLTGHLKVGFNFASNRSPNSK